MTRPFLDACRPPLRVFQVTRNILTSLICLPPKRYRFCRASKILIPLFFLQNHFFLKQNMDYAMEASSVPIEHKFEPYDDNGG